MRKKYGAEVRQKHMATDGEAFGDFLLAQHVARRCSVLDDQEKKRLVLWIQDISIRQGFQKHPTCSQFPAWPLPFPESYNGETGLDLLVLELLIRARVAPKFKNRRAAKDWIIRLALNPDNLAFERPGSYLAVPEALKILYTIWQDVLIMPRAGVADTATKRAIWDMLDYCLESRSLGLAVGGYRCGKSLSAQSWCLSRGGHVRYIQLTSAPTQEAFFRQIGRALGVTHASNLSPRELCERISAAVFEQQVMLVFDEGQYLVSHSLRSRQAPQRIAFVMTTLCNSGVPVAIIANRDWPRLVANLKASVSWFGWEQWDGRLKRNINLPDTLTEKDLREVAMVLAPEADRATLTLLAGCALRHTGHLGTIEAVVSLARFLAQKDDKQLDFDFVQMAMAEIDPTFQPVFPKRPLRVVRSTSAEPPQSSRQPAFPSHDFCPVSELRKATP